MAYKRSDLMEQRIAENRARILEAARQRIALGGFREAQIAAVAADAGVSTGLIYRYFPSKAELFVEVLTAAVLRIDACMAVLVIAGALLGIAQHFVGFGGLFELLDRVSIAGVAVGMVFQRQFAIRDRDLSLGCVLRHGEHFVIVAFGHRGHLFQNSE